ncbi:MAG: SDR family oxidoreductase [Candidatus Eremiobacteraeota bacterium]|nr:SDR family oxidoreductase [Candidatus Eremiobacteraeota bacterium]
MAKEKVVVITGASHGIGAGLVSAFSEAGYNVVANSRSIGASTDPSIVNIAGDVGEAETADRIINEGVGRFSRLDTLVNNAGIFIAKPFTQYTVADYEAMLATNVTGFFHLTQRAMRLMERQGWGHIVNITTTVAEQPISGSPAVLASLTKGALNAATKALAIEYGPRGIRANSVSLGIIKTQNPDSYAGLESSDPLCRLGEIDDVVSAVMYLERAEFVTGEISHVDGGQSAGHW